MVMLLNYKKSGMRIRYNKMQVVIFGDKFKDKLEHLFYLSMSFRWISFNYVCSSFESIQRTCHVIKAILLNRSQTQALEVL